MGGGHRQGERGQHGRYGMQGFHRGSLEKVVRRAWRGGCRGLRVRR
ncbi:hypothetical protein MYA_3338 [Burkholderia sp. KJ006]|nr:hypothetical protein MYA_3338 [Burkholderia sp. KJ006]